MMAIGVKELKEQLKLKMVGSGEGDAVVEDLDVRAIQDLDDLPAWRVILYLTQPKKDAWDVVTTRSLKRAAREALDHLLSAAGLQQEGVTSVSVTAKTAPVTETAEDDIPDKGEILAADNGISSVEDS